jgi:hypothetical protein
MTLPTIVQTDLRSVWTSLSLLNKLFALFFCGVFLYTLSLSMRALCFIHSFRRNVGAEPTKVSALLHRFSNLRQLHLLTLYIFGFCIAMQIPDMFYSVNDAYDLHGVSGLTFLFRCNATVFSHLRFYTSCNGSCLLSWMLSPSIDNEIAARSREVAYSEKWPARFRSRITCPQSLFPGLEIQKRQLPPVARCA